jgi:hypothetical protein
VYERDWLLRIIGRRQQFAKKGENQIDLVVEAVHTIQREEIGTDRGRAAV